MTDIELERPGFIFNGNLALTVVWANFNTEEEHDELLALHDWVQWIAHRYHLDARIIPECWPAHGELIEELSALHGGWSTAFSTASTGAHTLRWHEQFADARHRLTDWAARTGCRPAHHRPPP